MLFNSSRALFNDASSMPTPETAVSEERPSPIEPPDPRVYYAAERTLLAWIRTGLALMGFGFVVARFGLFLGLLAARAEHHPPTTGGMSLWFGTILILLGVGVLVLAGKSHVAAMERLQRGEMIPIRKYSLAVILASLLALLGLGTAAYLLSTVP